MTRQIVAAVAAQEKAPGVFQDHFVQYATLKFIHYLDNPSFRPHKRQLFAIHRLDRVKNTLFSVVVGGHHEAPSTKTGPTYR
jgi:hypothetical protein